MTIEEMITMLQPYPRDSKVELCDYYDIGDTGVTGCVYSSEDRTVILTNEELG